MLHSLESRNIHKLLPIPVGACRLEHRKIELSSLRPSGFKYTRLRLVKLLIFSLKVVVLPPHFGKSSWKWNAHCQLDFAGRNEWKNRTLVRIQNSWVLNKAYASVCSGQKHKKGAFIGCSRKPGGGYDPTKYYPRRKIKVKNKKLLALLLAVIMIFAPLSERTFTKSSKKL